MLSRRSFLISSAAMPMFSRMARAEQLQPSGNDDTPRLQAAISTAAKVSGAVQLGAGIFNVSTLTIEGNVTILGLPGATKLVSRGEVLFSVRTAKQVEFNGMSMALKGRGGRAVSAEAVERLIVEDCDFSGGAVAMRISSCGGRIMGNRLQFHDDVGLKSTDSSGLTIASNHISDIGNCGIQVWQSEQREDGSIVTGNHIERIAARDGGNGQNGNGINIFKAGNVTVANNRITDCAFTGIRNNSGANAIISGNSISRCNEVALFVEFQHHGSVVADNLIDTASQGIEIVNFDVGGRLSQCTGNVLRNLNGTDTEGLPLGGGILCEADVIVANNVVDIAKGYGIRLGWGPYDRNLQASNNTLMECRRGIEFSTLGEGPYIISNNIISGASDGAIVGMDHRKPATADLSVPGAALPAGVSITGNMIRN